MNRRHHAAHPATSVKPNADINKKPESYTPKAPAFEPSGPPNTLANVTHNNPSAVADGVHGQPKGSGAAPIANNQNDGTQNANDSPAGTAGFGTKVS